MKKKIETKNKTQKNIQHIKYDGIVEYRRRGVMEMGSNTAKYKKVLVKISV